MWPVITPSELLIDLELGLAGFSSPCEAGAENMSFTELRFKSWHWLTVAGCTLADLNLSFLILLHKIPKALSEIVWGPVPPKSKNKQNLPLTLAGAVVHDTCGKTHA
jgi:hypothetical protein